MQTVIHNTGGARVLGYVPPHGRFMAAGASITIEGDLKTLLASGRGRFSRSRELAALDADILASRVIITDQDDSSSNV